MLTSARLCYVPTAPEHAAGLLRLWADPEVVRYTTIPVCTTPAPGMERVSLYTARNRELPCCFTILRDGAVAGICGYPPVDREKGVYGFYYQLGRALWGQGYGSEAAGAMLREVLALPGVRRICADVVAENAASIAILRRLGFRQAGIHRGKPVKGEAMDIIDFVYEAD